MKHFLVFRICLALTFLVSGVFINLVQFVLYFSLRYYNIDWYRKINYYLIYSSWSQIVALSEWWSGSSCRLFFPDDESKNNFGKEHCFIIMNHKYEIDWLNSWMTCDKYGGLGAAKSFAKKSLVWMPVIGWAWVLGEFIFLERNYEKDSKIMGDAIKRLMDYKDKIMILFFAEGTRYTESKYKASVEFAKSKGLRSFKYHLVPRVKGFAFTVRKLKEINPNCALYNIQLAFKPDSSPTFSDIFKGIPHNGDMFIKRIPISDVPTEDDDKLAEYLYDMYSEKDDLVDYHREHQRFPGELVIKKRRLAPLINMIAWLTIILSSVCYLLMQVYTSHSFYLKVFTTIIIFLAYLTIHLMMKSTNINRGSAYGKNVSNEAKATKSNNDAVEDMLSARKKQ